MALTQQRSSFSSILCHSHSFFIWWILYIESHKLILLLENKCISWVHVFMTWKVSHFYFSVQTHICFILKSFLLYSKKNLICCLRPIKAHTNILASRSVQFGQLPLLFILPPVSYLNLLPTNFSFQASSCTCWFEPYMVANPKDRFSRDKANFMNGIVFLVQT